MGPKFAQVRAEAFTLTEEERVQLAEELYDSVEEVQGTREEIDAAWAEEIANRVEAFERGELESIDGEEVFRRIRAQYER